MLSGCFASGRAGALYKIDGIMMKNVEILKKRRKTTTVKLKLGQKWVFQMDNFFKHTDRLVSKWLNNNTVSVLSGHHKPKENLGQSGKVVYEQGVLQN